MQHLIYRKQFVLSNQEFKIFSDWKRIEIRDRQKKWKLYYHPDLQIHRSEKADNELILIGYILDPANPSLGNEQIMENILRCDTFDVLAGSTDQYNGRFILIYRDHEGLKILNDATGFREVYYAYVGDAIACGSTSTILSDCLDLPVTKNQDILKFYHSQEYIESDHNWTGYHTMYDPVMHLPPNHYLDVAEGNIRRFWPVKHLERISLEECAQACAGILKGTIDSALNRYQLHMGLTAGWDTRLLLSAAKENKDRIYFYVNQTSSISKKPFEIEIPSKLAEILDFNLHIIPVSDEVDPEFKKIYLKNNILAHEKLLPVFYEVYKRNWADTYTVSGTMGNAMARVYMRLPRNTKITGNSIARMIHMRNQPYVVSALNEWVDNVMPVCEAYGVDIMDLYQWEQENAHWASLTASEQDIVREEIRPFNNRKLIELFFSLDEKYRFQFCPEIYIRIMQILWPEVMCVHMDPIYNKLFIRFLRTIGLERSAYSLFKSLQYRFQDR